MVSGKSLPSFPAFDARPRAGDSSVIVSLQESASRLFFHCMSDVVGGCISHSLYLFLPYEILNFLRFYQFY